MLERGREHECLFDSQSLHEDVLLHDIVGKVAEGLKGVGKLIGKQLSLESADSA